MSTPAKSSTSVAHAVTPTTPSAGGHTSTTSSSSLSVSLEGWLEKQADWKFAWNRRFVSLCGTTLSYREEGGTADKKCAQVLCLQKRAGAPNTFRVWTERGGCWVLRAECEADYDRWTKAISDALHESHPTESMSGIVEKCSAWTKQWRSRYLTLDGLQLSYSDKQGDPIKNKYVIAAADVSLSSDHEVKIQTTGTESFMLRFKDQIDMDRWMSAIRRAQRRVHTLRWQRVIPVGDGKWYCGAISHASANFEGKHVLLFGGSVTQPNQSKALQRELVMVSLVGEHPASIMNPAPFEEGPNAKVRPQGRELAASAFLLSGRYVLFGGTTSSPMDVLGDCWVVHVAARGGWIRVAKQDELPLPRRFGHSLHRHASGFDTFLVVGGYDHRFQATSDVWKCGLSMGGNELVSVQRLPSLDQPRALHCGVTMDDGAVVLVGGCGGRYRGGSFSGASSPPQSSSPGPHDAASDIEVLNQSISLLAPGEDSWISVPLSPPLSQNFSSAAAAPHGNTIFVWGPASASSTASSVVTAATTPTRTSSSCDMSTTPFALYGISLSVSHAIVTEYRTRGDVPPVCRGLSMHISDDTCYLIGAGHDAMHRLLLPTSPTLSSRFLAASASSSDMSRE